VYRNAHTVILIGIAVSASDLRIAEELFELFKTPWQPIVPGRKYPVILSTIGRPRDCDADVFLLYGTESRDHASAAPVDAADGPTLVECEGATLPIYGRVAAFGARTSTPKVTWCGQAVDYCQADGPTRVWRIAYDLLREVEHLFERGQPAAHAEIPTLELHIALLRSLLRAADVPFVEVPPRPNGCDFTCCLTHDVDFFGIRRHKFDRTLAGFAARASAGTLADVVRGRRPATDALRNGLAVVSLPFVFCGLAADLWRPLDDYRRVEDPRRSTFFIVPFKNRPGVGPDGRVNTARAVPYAAGEIQRDLRRAIANETEIGVHAIDAWRDPESGHAELREVCSAAGRKPAGVRTHWLYFDQRSPTHLEQAGFTYDSSCGYNDAVGFRAGTSQVFRLQATRDLMELPLSIMDTALFYRERMGLNRAQATATCDGIIEHARRFGGTVVVNWHCRSLAPERLWDGFYRDLLKRLDAGGRTWFTTASNAVDWFRYRRAIRFEAGADLKRITISAPAATGALPPPFLSVYQRGGPVETTPLPNGESVTVEL
jgi:hypothetical protein